MPIQHEAIIKFYTLQPPRRAQDVGNITIGPTEDKTKNELILNERNIPDYIIYNNYKTVSAYGVQKLKIPRLLGYILQEYIKQMKLKPGMPLFPTREGKFYKNFSEPIAYVFKEQTGHKLSVDLLRHSFISDFLKSNPSKARMKTIAGKMAHSINTQLNYNRVNL